MASFEETYTDNHRRQQNIVFMMSLLTLVLATVPRHERALFITNGAGISAFGAGLPSTDVAAASRIPTNLFAPTIPSAFFARRPIGGIGPAAPGSAVGPGGGAAPFSAPGDSVGSSSPGTQLASINPTDGGTGTGNPGGGSAFPFVPPALGGTSASPSAPSATTTALTPVVTPTPAPSGGTTVPPTGVVAAVPEPTSWAMLIAGLAVVGMFLRRRGWRGTVVA